MELKKLLNKFCETPQDKYLLLKRRDDLMSQARVHNFDLNASNVILGTLKEMCPEKERYSRQMQHTESYYECDGDVFNPDIAVKEYSRSAADQELPLPHEMRPIETLELTMDFLMSEVADDNVSNSNELLRWFDFLWNRTRAIRKDITQQQLVSERVVGLIEKCARFHIFSGYKLAPFSPQFDQRLNIENLNKCLLSLRHCYDDLARKNIICPNEAEFRSYDILLNLCDSNVFNQSCQYREEIQSNNLVQNALEIALSFHTDNISRFFILVAAEETSFLQSCLCYNHFQAFRSQLLMQAAKSFTAENNLNYLTSFFFFEKDKDCLDFLTYHGCTIKESRPERTTVVIATASPQSELKDFPDPIVSRKINCSVSEIIYKGIPPKVKPPKATNSFDSQDRYVHDPILMKFLQEIGEQSETTINRKSTPFSFGPSSNDKNILGTNGFSNKHLFQQGYSKDPNETFPVTLF
uniref:SAC3/GANP/THP3 conserved domain-containing protein n=1 Tax=Panagrolaimus sp. ES5 TaxID=591445 RepID=A0AC34FSQ1_9BILA